jgi:16S rRNA (uracil1498-N3)-methyltransferase
MARGAGGKDVRRISSSCGPADPAAPGDAGRSLPRVFLPQDAFSDGTAVLDGQAFRHVVRVLRMGAGGRLVLLDGTGRAWVSELNRVGRFEASALLVRGIPEEGQPLREVHLAVPPLKGDRTELVLQKCTELGVSSFHIYPAERSVVRLEGRAEARRERFVSVCRSAAEQCGAFRLPDVHIWESPAAFLQQVRTDARFIAWEREDCLSARSALEGEQPCTLATGPEGGFSQREVDLWSEHGFRPVSLGRRILRAETAPIALCALALCSL